VKKCSVLAIPGINLAIDREYLMRLLRENVKNFSEMKIDDDAGFFTVFFSSP